jgi:hypothetical protein
MRLLQLITEANIIKKIIKDPKTIKMLGIAMRHDHTLPNVVVAKLGPRPTDEELATAWSDLLDNALRSSNHGDLSRDGKFDDWLLRLYINGLADWEDISGEAVDALGVWSVLSVRGKLRPEDQDFNKFKNISRLDRIKNDRQYRIDLDRISKSAEIERIKKTKEEIVIISNERFHVIIPLNYGSCYVFNNADGYQGNFCTGSSQGLSTWFPKYSTGGIIVSIFDKTNQDSKDGKWQLHASSSSLYNADQDDRNNTLKNDTRFAELFPGLMKQIVIGIEQHADEIKKRSEGIVTGGYDIAKEISKIKTAFPISYTSEVPDAMEPNTAEPNTAGGTVG